MFCILMAVNEHSLTIFSSEFVRFVFLILCVNPHLKLKLMYVATLMRRGVVSITKNGCFCFRSVEQLPEIPVATVQPLNISSDVPHFLYANVGLVSGIRKAVPSFHKLPNSWFTNHYNLRFKLLNLRYLHSYRVKEE